MLGSELVKDLIMLHGMVRLDIPKWLEGTEKASELQDLFKKRVHTIEGGCLDLSLGHAALTHEGKGRTYGIWPTQRILPEQIDYEWNGTDLVIHGMSHVRVQTMEHFNIPNDISPRFDNRTTTGQGDLCVLFGKMHPGYQGKIWADVFNFGDEPRTLGIGSLFMTVSFERIEGKCTPYNGPRQGGNHLGTGKEERPF